MQVKIYTDGACSHNPGPGGYGIILSAVLPNGQLYEKKYSGGYRLTTNNRMELMGVIIALSHLNGAHDIEIISDSKYVCDAFNQKWIYNWQRNGWTKGKNGKLPNADLWRTLWNLITMQKSYKFQWVKGHHVNQYNNECDRLAVEARKDTANLDIDINYEQGRC